MEQHEVVLACNALEKSFGAVHALRGLDFQLRRGEVRALLGKNGAGKSTLVNLVSGAFRPDHGTIEVAGVPVRFSRPVEARDLGISVVHQEFSLVPGLSVAENITLGDWPNRAGFVNFAAMESRAKAALQLLGVHLPLHVAVGELSIAEQQLVEIAKAMGEHTKVLILDEPTSALNNTEVEGLLQLVRRLAERGVAVIYVSHRMKEIPLVADTLTVMRDGREIHTSTVSEVNSAEVARLIAGGALTERSFTPTDRSDAPVVLSVRDARFPGVLHGVNFDVHRGEVLGIAGLLGSGRTELLETIFGSRPEGWATVSVAGRIVKRRSPRRLLDRGVALTSEDRKGSGVVPLLSVAENLILSARGRVLPKLLIRSLKERDLVRTQVTRLSIRALTPTQAVGTLSGGNQQKAVIGRAMAASMKVLLLDEPTRGIDVAAKTQIYGLIRDLADAGVASVFVSSELEELPEVCDRVLVLRGGVIAEEISSSEASSERILSLAMKESA